MNRSPLWPAAVIAIVSSAPAQAADDKTAPPPPTTVEDLDRRLADVLREAKVPGAAVAVVEAGKVALLKGYGMADAAAGTAATPDTTFRAGSISKSLTSIAIMKLVEQGKLTLDAKLSDLAPEIKTENPWQATDPVRLVHLLEHTAGWPDISLDVLVKDAPGWSLRQGVEYASSRYVSRWRPGLYSTYNNAGPSVAGYVLEKASGQTFSAFAREQVLRPMGMAQADFDLTPELKARLAKSYGPDGSESPYQTIILPPSGSLATSARDLAQLVLFFLGRGSVDGRAILSPASVDRIEHQETAVAARAGLTNGYGLGNALFPGDNYDFRGHNGGIDSFTSVYGYAVVNASGFVVLVNGGGGADFGAPEVELIEAYLMRAVPRPTRAEAVAPEQLAKHAGFYASVSPTYEFLRIFGETVFLPLQRVSLDNLRLNARGELIPLGPNLFRRPNRTEPTVGFIDFEGEHLRVTGLSTARREPMLTVVPKLTVLAVLVVTALLAVLALPFQLASLVRGRLREHGGMMVRLLPFAALATLIVTFVCPIVALASQSPKGLRALAAPSPLSLGVLVSSLAFPLLAALGLWRALTTPNVGRYARVHAAVASIAVLLAALYAAGYGWIGVRTWNW